MLRGRVITFRKVIVGLDRKAGLDPPYKNSTSEPRRSIDSEAIQPYEQDRSTASLVPEVRSPL